MSYNASLGSATARPAEHGVAFGFASFSNVIDRRPAASMVDLSWGEDGPDEDRAWSVVVEVALRAPRPDGLADSAEESALVRAGVVLEAALWRDHKAVFVGTRTHDGRATFVFYTSEGAGAAHAARAALEGLGLVATCAVAHDPEWAGYSRIYPPPVVLQDIRNRGLLERMVRMGDPIDQPREVRHHLSFADRAGADAARRDAVRAGLAPKAVVGPEGRPHGVFVRQEVPLDSHFLGIASLLHGLAELHGGVYDGWDADRRRT